MLTVTEAGEALGIGRATAYRLAREGVIPTQLFGQQLRVPVGWVLEQGGMNTGVLLASATSDVDGET